MIPLSCLNCCHNPLQLGAIGTAFGYCTRHHFFLNQPQHTTCGQLLRKDLLLSSAERQRTLHERSYSKDWIAVLATPSLAATKRGLVETSCDAIAADPVLEEVRGYGSLDSKIASMAALHRIPGARAEVAMLSLSRSYLSNCYSRGGSWTAGLHLLFWTLERLDSDPGLSATDLHGPIAHSLGRTIDVARWTVLAFRLALVSDVGQAATSDKDRVGRLADLAGKAVAAAPGTDPDRLLAWLGHRKATWGSALSRRRYSQLSRELHQPDEDHLSD